MSYGEISPTVYGIETEYSILVRYPHEVVHEIVGMCHSVDAKLGLYAEPEEAGSHFLDQTDIKNAFSDMGMIVTESGMLSNGGRFYMDPSGPEYATPETTTAEEAVHRTFEGDYIMRSVLDYQRKVGNIDSYQLNRRIIDHNRSSRGVHLNTTTSVTHQFNEGLIPRIAAINVAKGALFGSGGLLLDEDGSTAYHHSPRLSVSNKFLGGRANYYMHPLVRVPFEQDCSMLRRVETVTSDALNFGWPLRASLVMSNALMKLIELRQERPLLVLSDPVVAAHTVGRYGNEQKIEVTSMNGRESSVFPIDILRATCELILNVDHRVGHLDDESRQVIPEIIETADMMKEDEYSVATRVESVARKRAIERKMEKSKVDIDSEKICSYDYYWDWCGGGLAQQLREKKLIGWDGFKSTRSARPKMKLVASPPRDTRAKIRSDQIHEYGDDNASTWDMIDFDDLKHYVSPTTSEIALIDEKDITLKKK